MSCLISALPVDFPNSVVQWYPFYPWLLGLVVHLTLPNGKRSFVAPRMLSQLGVPCIAKKVSTHFMLHHGGIDVEMRSTKLDQCSSFWELVNSHVEERALNVFPVP